MVKELVTTQDQTLATLCAYLYGIEAVHRLDVPERGRTSFSLDIPQKEFQALETDLHRDEITVQLFSYERMDSKLRYLIRQARRAGGNWCSEAWVRGDFE